MKVSTLKLPFFLEFKYQAPAQEGPAPPNLGHLLAEEAI